VIRYRQEPPARRTFGTPVPEKKRRVSSQFSTGSFLISVGRKQIHSRARCTSVVDATSQEGGNPSPTLQANSSPLNHGLSLPSCAWQMSQPHPGPYFYKASRVCACARSSHVPSKPITRQFPAILIAPMRLVSPPVSTSSESEGLGEVWLLMDKLHGTLCRGGTLSPGFGGLW